MKFKNLDYYIELAARCHVFLLLNTYGLGKIAGGQFYRKGEIPSDVAAKTLAEAGSFDLAWTFMGHSNAYILFIGISQVIGAWCLIWNKTKFIGIIILMPILLNIIVFDIIFLDTYGALASALIYFGLLIVVIVLNKQVVLEVLVKITTGIAGIETNFKDKLKTWGVVAILVMLIFTVEQTIVNFIGH